MIMIDPNVPPGCLDSEREESLGLLSLSSGFHIRRPICDGGDQRKHVAGTSLPSQTLYEVGTRNQAQCRPLFAVQQTAWFRRLACCWGVCRAGPHTEDWCGCSTAETFSLPSVGSMCSSFPTPVHTVVHTAVSPHLYTLSYIQPFSHTCTHCRTYIQPFPHTCTHCHTYSRFPTPVHTVVHTYSRFPTPVHTVIHTAASPHLYTLSYIHTYSRFPTPVHTVIHTYLQQFPHTCTHCHTYIHTYLQPYSSFPTPVHTVIHTYLQLFPHTCTHCHTYIPPALQLFPHTCTHCHTYIPPALQLFPHTCTHCHTYIPTAVSPHLYTLSYIHTYSSFPTPVPVCHHTCKYCATSTPTCGISAVEFVMWKLLQVRALLPVGFQQWSLSCESYCRSEHSYLWDFSSGVCHVKVTAGQSSPDMGCLTWPTFGCGPSRLSQTDNKVTFCFSPNILSILCCSPKIVRTRTHTVLHTLSLSLSLCVIHTL